MQYRPKIKQVQNHRMPSALDTPLKGRSIGCTLNRQSDSTKQQREGHLHAWKFLYQFWPSLVSPVSSP